MVARLALERVVRTRGSDERANEHKALGERRDLRHKLSEIKSGDCRAQWTKLTADVDGCIGLRVDHVHVRRAAVEMDVDDRFARGADPSCVFGAEQSGEVDASKTRAGKAGSTDGQEPPATETSSTDSALVET